MKNGEDQYLDILHLPHHVSKKRRRMTARERAAQFSPFAALTGYDTVIREEARLTGCRRELAEDEKTALDRKFRLLADRANFCPQVTVTSFCRDERKEGGSYETVTGILAGISAREQWLCLTDGTRIALGDIWALESPELEDIW